MGAVSGARALIGRTLALGALLAVATTAVAQQPEFRVDALGPAPWTASSGAGLVVPFGYYARGSADVSYGLRRVAGSYRSAVRGDLLVRFLFDPFGEERWGLSVGGGLSVRRVTYLALVADLEGPSMLGFRPAVQAGVSGGWRAGVVLRRAVSDRR
jgi:hypothetical protein